MKKDLEDLKHEYQMVFTSKEGGDVLKDLKSVCYYGFSPYVHDSMRETDRRIAKQEVFQYIADMLGEETFKKLQTEVLNND